MEKTRKKRFCIVVPTSFMLRYFKGQLCFLNQTFEVMAISSDPVWLENFGKTEGIDTCCIPIARFPSITKDIRSFWRLYCFFRQYKPYIVHGNTSKALLPLLAARLAHVPVRVYMAHGALHQGYTGVKRILVKVLEYLMCSCSTEVLCVSFGVKNLLFKERICGKKDVVKVIGNGTPSGINMKQFDKSLFNNENLRNALGIPLANFVFCFVGRINREKGVNELVDAFNELSSLHKDICLLLVGPEEEHRAIDENTKKVISDNRLIHSLGYQEDVRPYVALSDTLVLPSYREGLSLTLIEAGAMGIPCITTDIMGCNEVIKDGITGRIVPPRDKKSLYKMMAWFYDHRDDELKKMAECARQSIAERYEQHNTWTAYRDEYTSL